MEPISILFIATFVEGLITYLFGEHEFARPYLKYVALALGVAMAVIYKIDIPSMVGLSTSTALVNQVVSGFIIGRGSNYVNDIVGAFRKK